MNIGNIEVRIVRGDIIQLNADAIVNPADGQLKMMAVLGNFCARKAALKSKRRLSAKVRLRKATPSGQRPVG